MERLPPPPPPESLPELRPRDVKTLTERTRIWRIYSGAGQYPGVWNGFRHFGPRALGRFDHHPAPPRPQDRGILYGVVGVRRHGPGSAAFTCVAEFFQDTATIDPVRDDPWLAGLALARPLLLLDVTSAWTTRAGGNQAICSGERAMARAWSRAIYERYEDIDGIYYTSSTYGPGHALALYERAGSALAPRPSLHRPLSDPGLRDFLRRAARELEYDLL